MISASYIYDTILTLIRKDQHGNSFNIDEFNRIIKLVNYELYNSYAGKVGEDISNVEALKDFMVYNASVAMTAGVGSLPTGYERLMGNPHWTGLLGAEYIPLDVVNALELKIRRDDYLTQPSVTWPVAYIGGAQVASKSQIQVHPVVMAGMAAIIIDYLRLPATPFLDYYVASTGLYVYMAASPATVSIPAGATYRDGTAGPLPTQSSSTVNFEWGEDQTPIIINMILQKAGIVLEKQVAIEYGIARETKEAQND